MEVIKILKLSGGDWYLVFGNGSVKRLNKKELRYIADKATRYIRAAFINTIGDLVEFTEDEKFKLKRKSNLSSLIYKKLPKETFFEIDGNTVHFYKDSLHDSLHYFQEKDIKSNLLQGKLIALKSLPIIRQAKNKVVRSIEIKDTTSPKRKIVIIELALFKGAVLRWEQDFKVKKSDENSYLKLLERIRDKKYELAYAGFGYKERGNRRGPYLLFCYKVPVSERKKNGKVMGIDLGQECLAYFAVSDSHARGDLTKDSEFSPEWLRSDRFDWKKKIYAVWTKRKSLVRELHHINNLLKHEGGDENLKKRKKHVVKELESVRNYEANFMETLNKTVASIVRKIAEKEGVSRAVMEDISVDPEKKNSLMFPKWNYSQLQTYIDNKLKEIGVEVVKVNPACTSLRCPECGYIGFLKDVVRPERGRFVSPSCKYKDHADYVGARNLATEGIEGIINEYLKAQIKALGGDHRDLPPEKNHILASIRRKVIRKRLNEYLGLPENTSLKKALKELRKRDYNIYERFVKDPVKFLREATKPPRLLDS